MTRGFGIAVPEGGPRAAGRAAADTARHQSAWAVFAARHAHKLILAIAAAAGGWLRFADLDYSSLRFDEALFYHIVSGDFARLLETVRFGHSSPPLFPALLLLFRSVNDSEVILRLLPALAGLAGVFAVYGLARRFLARNQAAVAALFAAVAPVLVYLGREVRETALVFAASCLILQAAVVYMRVPKLPPAWISAALQVTGLFLHYSLALLSAGIHLYILCRFCRRRMGWPALRRWMAAHSLLIPGAIAVYWLALRWQFYPGRGKEYLPGYWDHTWSGLASLAVRNTVQIWNFAYDWWPILTFAVILAGAAFWARRRHTRVTPLGLALSIYGVNFATALLSAYPYTYSRHSLFAAPLLYVLAASALRRKLRPAPAVAQAVCVAGLAAWMGVQAYSSSRYAGGEEIRPIYLELQKAHAPGDRIFVTPGAIFQFRYYNRTASLPVREGTPSPGYLTGLQLKVSLEAGLPYVSELSEELARPGRLWIVFSHFHPGEPGAARVLRACGPDRKARLFAKRDQVELYLAE